MGKADYIMKIPDRETKFNGKTGSKSISIIFLGLAGMQLPRNSQALIEIKPKTKRRSEITPLF